MTEAVYVAKNTLFQQQVGEKKEKTEDAKHLASVSFSRTPTASTQEDCSVESCSSPEHFLPPSMGKEDGGEQNELDTFESTQQEAIIPGSNNKEEASFALSEKDRLKNPDPDKSQTACGVVVPSVIRISPSTSDSKNNLDCAPVVRPRASKTPPQPEGAPQNCKPRRKEEVVRTKEKQSHMGERGGKGGKQVPKKEEAKGRDEAQVSFPRRKNKTKQMTSGMAQDGQAPTQQVQYSNAGARHGHRQDPYGYRQQHTRGQHSTSVTSSAGGTPTLAPRRAPQHPRGFSAGSDMDNEPSPSAPPVTPMFQRLVTDEVQELKTYTRIIEEQNRRVTELERRTADLEKRLQKGDKDKADLERTLEYRETEWRNKFERLESDRDHQKELVEQEKRMNSKLNYQVVQMEQEIHKFLTRKYPQQRDNTMTSSMRNVRVIQSERSSPSLASGLKSQPPPSPGRHDGKKQFKSPREILENDGRVEVVRKRNIANSLLDFFGMP